jgi:hypothetical protein
MRYYNIQLLHFIECNIIQLLHLNEINMRFYGAEYNNIERGECRVQYCCTLLHKTSYWSSSRAITLNNDIATIHAWSTKWLVNFNPKKTETMTITRKINKPFHPPLIMNNVTMSFINIMKNSGCRIDLWETPTLIVWHLECALSITTRCFLSVR